MKKIITIIAMGASALVLSQTEEWIQIGDELTISNPGYTALEFDKNGNCYYIYSDQNNPSTSLNVQKFDGLTWSFVGPENITSGSFIRGKDIAFDTTGVPYVAFANGTKDLTVVKFNGTNWDTVGIANFANTDGLIGNPDIEIDPTTNRPVVAFHDDSSDRLSVMKFDGANWVYLNGGQDISTGTVSLVSMTIDDVGVVYLGYADENNMLTVQSTWTGGTVWNVNAINNNTQTISELDIDTDGVYPVLSYIDLVDNKVYSRRYSGAPTWYRFDESIGTADYYDIVAVKRREWNTYVGFSDTDNFYGSSTFKISDAIFLNPGASAEEVGTSGELGSVTPYKMTFGVDQDDTLYVAFGNLTIEVYQFVAVSQAGLSDAKNHSSEVFPNPATNQITIRLEEFSANATIQIFSIDGNLVYSSLIEDNTHQIDVSRLTQGSYFITVTSNSAWTTSKFIIQ